MKTIEQSFNLLEQAKTFLARYTPKAKQLAADIDAFLMQPITTDANAWQVLVKDPTTKDLHNALGISDERCLQLANDVAAAFKLDIQLGKMPGRPHSTGARLMTHATKNCTSVNETSWVAIVTHIALGELIKGANIGAAIASALGAKTKN